MDGDDKVIDVVFMVGKEWVNMGLVDELGALSLGKDKVAEEEKTDGRVEG